MAKRKRHTDVNREVINKSNPGTPLTNSNPRQERGILNDGLLNLYQEQASDMKEKSLRNPSEDTDEKPSEKAEETSKTTTKGKRIKNTALSPKYSSVTFTDVGGMKDILNDIFRFFIYYKVPTLYSQFQQSPIRGVLLYGPPGCGKTHLVRAIAGEMKIPFIEVAVTELICGISGESENKLREVFDAASAINGRCILFIDEIDAICPKREAGESTMMRRMVSQMLKSMDELEQKDPAANVMVFAATNLPDSLDPALRRGDRFDRELAIGFPDEEARLNILEVICKALKLPEEWKKWLAHHTPGYVGADLKTLIKYGIENGFSRMYTHLVKSNSLENRKISTTEDGVNVAKKLTVEEQRNWFESAVVPESDVERLQFELEDFQIALHQYVPSSKREGFATVPDTTWSDIGALEHVKRELRKAILWPVQYIDFYKKNKLSSTKGILLYGPKGCGKTLLAKAIANECSINFLSVSGPELLSMYVGESERAVRRCFERARNSAPCVVFFDEFDALCPPRTSSKENSPIERVVNQLLTEADGMQDRKQVFLVAATNRLDKIDSAMLRPGRLEKTLYVGLPTPEGRVDILKRLTKDKTQPKFADGLELETIALDSRCENFSGADLAYLVREATSGAMEEMIESPEKTSLEEMVLHLRHFDAALKVVKPSFSEQDRKYFERSSSHH